MPLPDQAVPRSDDPAGAPSGPAPGYRPDAHGLHPAVARYLPGVDPGLPLTVEDGPGSAAVGFARVDLEGTLGPLPVILVAWHFGVSGGSFGERDATTFVAACAAAAADGVPLVAVTASGGTRLTEGVPGLRGMARATLARDRLAAAGVPLVVIAAPPTTGGVFVTVASRADLTCAVADGVVGFAGPRVVAATTGRAPGPDSHHAGSAAAAGLVDAVLPADQVGGWLVGVLGTLALRGRTPPVPAAGDPGPAEDIDPGEVDAGEIDAWAQVLRARTVERPGPGELLDRWLAPGTATLAAPHGDASVTARLGTLDGRPVVAVGLAAARGGTPNPDGYRLLVRAAGLAGRLRLPLLTLVDTPGASAGADGEADGVARSIAEAFAAVLSCPSPTLGVLIGEGGSGGALAALVCDRLLVTEDSYFAALVPEGAGAALRKSPPEAARLMTPTPHDLLGSGAVDGVVASASRATLRRTVGRELDRLTLRPDHERLAARTAQWSAPVGGQGDRTC